ncbi:MAG: hydroxysqualene dehydroxylase HpnE [Isosphaeraceae bacterium]
MKLAHKPAPPHVVIVGGGLAGLAAAAGLAEHGLRITLLESRPRLGGRASSFTDPVTGEQVDNCQHVSMACCTNLADFCQRVGIANLFRREPAVVFLSPAGRVSRLRAGFAPAPFHLAESFLLLNFLNWKDKLRIGYGLACLARLRDERPGEPMADWLRRHRQSRRTIDLFWSTVLVSALNERIDRMDVGHARKVFVDGFLSTRTGFQMELPLVPLGELYGGRLESWLRKSGVDVQLTSGIRMVDLDDDASMRGVVLRTGQRIVADFVILAVSFDRAPSLLPEAARSRLPALEGALRLESSPITGIHLWFDRPVCPLDHVATPGRLVQWVFNHTAIQGRQATGAMSQEGATTQAGDVSEAGATTQAGAITQAGATTQAGAITQAGASSQTGDMPPPGRAADAAAEGGQYLQVVISASYDLLSLDKLAIRDAVLADLAAIWPEAARARLLRFWVVTEHGATFAVRPGVDRLRPPQRTAIEGLFLAGDWTDTGWPATMEGAVRSGYLAAESVLEDLGRPARLVCPELAPGRLARWLLSLPSPFPLPAADRTLGASLDWSEPPLRTSLSSSQWDA